MTAAGMVTSVQMLLADGGSSPADVDPTTGHGPEWGKAAPIGLLVVVLLCVAVYFLVKSMNRNLRKVPESFDPAAAVAVGASPTDAAAPGAPDASGVSDAPGVTTPSTSTSTSPSTSTSESRTVGGAPAE